MGSVSETCCKSYCCQARSIDSGRGRFSVDIVVVAPGSSSVLRMLGNNYSISNVEGAVKPKQIDVKYLVRRYLVLFAFSAASTSVVTAAMLLLMLLMLLLGSGVAASTTACL